MANKILSFEEYFTKASTPQVEETEVEDLGNKEQETEEESTEHEAEETEEEEAEEEESEEEESDDEDESEEEESDDDEDKEDESPVSELLKKCYESACKEAVAYEGDDYAEHTIESYLKENAALCATLAADTLEKAHEKVREGELTVEMYEAACNEMKEAFVKKIDEVKEVYSAK
jgi:hypothetical protein